MVARRDDSRQRLRVQPCSRSPRLYARQGAHREQPVPVERVGILIAGDANYWYESGAVGDVTIRGNVLGEACLSSPYQFGEGIISIDPEIPKPDPAFPFHRNIRIENNEFHPSDYPVLYAKSVDGLTFSGNRLIRSRHFEPVHARKTTLTFEACRRVRVERNQLGDDVLGRNIGLKDTPPGEVLVGPGQGWVR